MKLPIHERVMEGVSQSPEGRGVFPNLTVLENLEMGAYRRKDKEEIKKIWQTVLNCFHGF